MVVHVNTLTSLYVLRGWMATSGWEVEEIMELTACDTDIPDWVLEHAEAGREYYVELVAVLDQLDESDIQAALEDESYGHKQLMADLRDMKKTVKIRK